MLKAEKGEREATGHPGSVLRPILDNVSTRSTMTHTRTGFTCEERIYDHDITRTSRCSQSARRLHHCSAEGVSVHPSLTAALS